MVGSIVYTLHDVCLETSHIPGDFILFHAALIKALPVGVMSDEAKHYRVSVPQKRPAWKRKERQPFCPLLRHPDDHRRCAGENNRIAFRK